MDIIKAFQTNTNIIGKSEWNNKYIFNDFAPRQRELLNIKNDKNSAGIPFFLWVIRNKLYKLAITLIQNGVNHKTRDINNKGIHFSLYHELVYDPEKRRDVYDIFYKTSKEVRTQKIRTKDFYYDWGTDGCPSKTWPVSEEERLNPGYEDVERWIRLKCDINDLLDQLYTEYKKL